MGEPLEVWYWVRGSSCSNVFSVEASLDTTLATVGQLIMESWSRNSGRASSGVPCLYKVPHPVDLLSDNFESVLGALSVSELGRPLRITRTKTLMATFTPQLQLDHLHFIADFGISILRVTYWIRGFPNSDFTIELPGEECLSSALKTRVKESWPPFKDVSVHNLRVYKISVKSDKELTEVLGYMEEGDVIPPGHQVDDAFRDIPFSSNTLKVVIEEVTSQKTTIPPLSRHHGHTSDKDTPARTVESERSKFLKENKKQKPSTTAAPSTFQKRQANSTQVIACGRPREYEDRIPVTLLHPIFAQFKEDARSIPLTATDDTFAIDLANAMSKIYPDESKRAQEIKSLLNTYGIHLNISKTQTAGYETDGDISTQSHRCVVAEFKNEVGCASKEPYFQAIGYYLEFTRPHAVKMSHSPLPCLLLSIYGPYIDFAGAAWNLRPTTQFLAKLAFHVHSTDTEEILVLARHMAAFRKATQTLKEYYDTLQPPSLSRLSSPQLFPHPTTYTSRITNQQVEIVYKKQISEEQLLFFGFEGSDKGPPICIKFVRQHLYSLDAHDYCVSLGCAPTLRGFETVVGGWSMVVMDDISDGYETLFDRPVSESIRELMAEKLSKFHQAGYVHGDLRDTNIMASKSDATDFKFIDFDWAGKVNETTYPPFINREFWRPDDARDWLPIRAEHDIEMLNHIVHWVPESRAQG